MHRAYGRAVWRVVERVLSESAFREGAKRIAVEIDALASPEDAANELLAGVRERSH